MGKIAEAVKNYLVELHRKMPQGNEESNDPEEYNAGYTETEFIAEIEKIEERMEEEKEESPLGVTYYQKDAEAVKRVIREMLLERGIPTEIIEKEVQ